MTGLIDDLHTALRRRAHYRNTLSELRRLPMQTVIDFDLDPQRFETLAHRAVYGH